MRPSSNQIDSWLTVDLTNKKLEKNICGRSGNQIDSWLTIDLTDNLYSTGIAVVLPSVIVSWNELMLTLFSHQEPQYSFKHMLVYYIEHISFYGTWLVSFNPIFHVLEFNPWPIHNSKFCEIPIVDWCYSSLSFSVCDLLVTPEK